jgi:predicted permease
MTNIIIYFLIFVLVSFILIYLIAYYIRKQDKNKRNELNEILKRHNLRQNNKYK